MAYSAGLLLPWLVYVNFKLMTLVRRAAVVLLHVYCSILNVVLQLNRISRVLYFDILYKEEISIIITKVLISWYFYDCI